MNGIILKSAGIITVLVLVVLGAASLKSGNGAKYSVDYCGGKDWYVGAKDRYAAGETVEVSFPMVATDTDYSFYLDGESINPRYEDGRGYVITFVMPEHDVRLECISRNSMIYYGYIEPGTMLIDSYSATVATVGGDGYHELVLSQTEDRYRARLDVYDGGDGTEEQKVSYLVPYNAVDDAYSAIRKSGMDTWSGRKDLVGITGARLVCKYRTESGEYVRCSSEAMPDDGKSAFYEVESAISAYIKEEYKIEE